MHKQIVALTSLAMTVALHAQTQKAVVAIDELRFIHVASEADHLTDHLNIQAFIPHSNVKI